MKKNKNIDWKNIDEFIIYEYFLCGSYACDDDLYLVELFDCDDDETFELYFFIPVSKIDYALYMDRKVTLFNLLKKAKFVDLYVSDITKKENPDYVGVISRYNSDLIYLCRLPIGAIHDDDFPIEDSFLPNLWLSEDEKRMSDLVKKIYQSDLFTLEQAYKDFLHIDLEKKNGNV